MEGQTLEDLWSAARALDLSGLKCPMPALMAAKALRQMQEGEMLAVIVTDPTVRDSCERTQLQAVAVRSRRLTPWSAADWRHPLGVGHEARHTTTPLATPAPLRTLTLRPPP